MKVVIIEDENLSAEHLTILLQKIDESITVIMYFDTITATVRAFKEGLRADLIFMDIHLADGNSFDIFNQIAVEIPVVFTTAFDDYAIQAFKQNSIDYLLKPIDIQELRFAIEKFKKQRKQIGNTDIISGIASAYQQMNKEYKTRFLVKSGRNIDTIKIEEIHHFETKESMSFLMTNSGNLHLIDYSLDQLEKMLPPKIFFRINRKIIINIQSIEKVAAYFNSRLTIATKFIDNNAKIVSRDRVVNFKKWLDD